MKAVHPYLNFPGNTEEAFNFYRSVFGGEFTNVTRYRDMPGAQVEGPDLDRIMNIGLRLSGETVLMATDVLEELHGPVQFGNNVHIVIEPETREETERVYRALSEGGKVEMPLGQTPWAELYAIFTDRFGVRWMVNYTGTVAFQPGVAQ
ncbi:MAG TPA: VOC family protein [Longimicrobiales bacterium]|nr:VOC family protein [Longimicrobiales bacterium]